MRARAEAWWNGRTERERLMLLLLAAIGLPILLWLAPVRPLAFAREAAEGRLRIVATACAETALAAAELRRVRESAAPAAGAPTSPAQAAQAAGFPVRAAPGGRLVLEAVRPQAFFTWATQMERQGLAIEMLQAGPNPDRTLRIEMGFRPAAAAQRQ